MSLHPEILSRTQRAVLKRLGPLAQSEQFYMAGGTALALRLGHRRSVDFDWFTTEALAEPLNLAQRFRDLGLPLVTRSTARRTLHGTVSGVRVSFLEYRYALLGDTSELDGFGCRLASIDDLACMKLSAVSQRGSKKDFVDIYFLIQSGLNLESMLQLFQKKFAVRDAGRVLYSLTYFDDADRERMPKMLRPLKWDQVKTSLRNWARQVE